MFDKLFLAVSAKLVEEKYALIIVDSVTALFRVDFSGRGELAERQQKLGLFMSRLMKLSEEFNVCVLSVFVHTRKIIFTYSKL